MCMEASRYGRHHTLYGAGRAPGISPALSPVGFEAGGGRVGMGGSRVGGEFLADPVGCSLTCSLHFQPSYSPRQLPHRRLALVALLGSAGHVARNDHRHFCPLRCKRPIHVV